ncbi:MAG TPA: hypothetical protein VMW10_05005 [Alphaproteobacteria bacterium]|nr:hypothetical protein [Alphaproteobacteria bacterium]
MRINITKLFLSYFLIISLFYTQREARGMEGQREEERDNAYSSLPHPSTQVPLKGVTLEDFTSYIKSNIDEDITGMILLTLGEVPEKFYFNYKASNSEEMLSFQSDVSDLSTLKSIAKIVPSSVDLITCGPRIFKKLYLEQQQLKTFLQILGSMLKKGGNFIVTQKEKCRKSLIEEDESHFIEEDESQPHLPRSILKEVIGIDDILSLPIETCSPRPDYPLLMKLPEKFLQSSEVTWETKKYLQLLRPHVDEALEKLIEIAKGFGFSGAPSNDILRNEEGLRHYIGLKVLSLKRKRENIKHENDKKEIVKRRRTDGHSYSSYEVFKTSDLYFVERILKEVFHKVYFYRKEKVRSKPSEKDNYIVVAQDLK